MDALTRLNALYVDFTAKEQDARYSADVRQTYRECATKVLAEIRALEAVIGHGRAAACCDSVATLHSDIAHCGTRDGRITR